MSDLNVYTTAQINALTPITGDMVVDSDLNAIKLYDGAAWRVFNADSTAVPYQNRWGASFDGSDDSFTTTLGSQVFSGDFTVSSWIKPTRAGNNTILFHLGSSNAYNDPGFRIYQQNGGFSFWDGFNSAYNNIFGIVGSESINSWQNLIVTRSGSAMTFYVDGISVGTGTNSSAYTNTAFVISYAQYTMFQGLMDEVAIFNTALSAADITKIYNGTAPNGKPTDLTLAASYDTANQEQNLAGYWRMGDDSNDSATSGGNIATITDSSGNGNDATQGTASNQPTFSDLTGETIYV